MKILQLGKFYPPSVGGIESVTYELSKELFTHGHQADVLCVNEVGKTTLIEKTPFTTIYRCRSLFTLATIHISLAYLYYWFLLKNKYDIIHIHSPNPLAYLAVFLFPTKSKICVHWHCDIVKFSFLKKIYTPLQQQVLKKADTIVTTSEMYAAYSNDLKPFYKKTICIPLGIDKEIQPINHDLQKKLEATYKGKKIIFSLGRHVYYKGFNVVIDAMRLLSEEYVLLLGGSGTHTEELKAQSNRHNLQHMVHFLGNIPTAHLSTYYSTCSVFCLSSIDRSEAFGVVLLEAMKHGAQVISTDIPGSGVAWVNKHNKTGKVIARNSPVALSKAIETVCKEPIPSQKITDYFAKNFTSEIMITQLLTLYSKLLAQGKKQ